MHPLDDPRTIQNLDRRDMYAHIHSLPEQIEQVWNQALDFTVPAPYIKSANIVILGMGGSAIGGSLVKSLLGPLQESIPVHILRDYDLPAFVNRNSLVIAVSYSGNTEETISGFKQAAERGAKLLAITTGGEIERLASRVRAPVFVVNYVAPPRAALAHLFIPLIAVMSKLGLLEFSPQDMTAALAQMRQARDSYEKSVPTSKNPAKKLAEKCANRIVITIGGTVLAEVARRWKTQINENAKNAAYTDVVPELCHNSIVGLEMPPGQNKQLMMLLLPSNFDNPRNKLRMQLFGTALSKRGIQHETVSADSTASRFMEFIDLIFLGDFMSYYLALLNKVDPTPIDAIDKMKLELERQR